MIMRETAHLYGISEQTLYRALAQRARPKALRRSDRGTPRVLPLDKMEYYCELIAAIKVRTSNQAEHSNDCWQFDLSPSDLKEVKEPLWLQANKGAPTLMLFSVVDDRSGVAYQEYRCVYGEDVEAALRFLFNAMAPKQVDAFPFSRHSQNDLPGICSAEHIRSNVPGPVMWRSQYTPTERQYLLL
jgi:hypothetical protein